MACGAQTTNLPCTTLSVLHRCMLPKFPRANNHYPQPSVCAPLHSSLGAVARNPLPTAHCSHPPSTSCCPQTPTKSTLPTLRYQALINHYPLRHGLSIHLPATYPASLAKLCLPLPPTPTSSAWPPLYFRTRQILHTCSAAYRKTAKPSGRLLPAS